MPRSPRFHPLFTVDVLQSADWYESKAVGLGVGFTHEVETGIEALLSDPERRSNFHYGFRYWPIQRFPHLILYDVTPSEVLLFGVMHPSQEPSQWIARLG
ncbi:type II toxin-antitoxin system RelE/ParE family toxin [Stieleria varia]|uniref:Plasmid stabilization system protein n=1 Tax=Stieleria varia TaxID=2528005 RepID=A0A5C6AMU8_9BACT|nr:type II toxin-antitoxin system RelE/ParE family toxin [Stieleria varia]TWU00828.1 hypothetical protein Pla52n_41970 [Stieleria varia]